MGERKTIKEGECIFEGTTFKKLSNSLLSICLAAKGVKIRAAIPYIYTAVKNLRSHLGLLTRYFFFNLPCIFKVCQKRKKGEKGREVNVAFCVIWQNLRPYFKYCYIKAEILKLLSDRLPYFHSFWTNSSFLLHTFHSLSLDQPSPALPARNEM